MTLLYTIAPVYVTVGIPTFLHAYFDIAMGLLQTYIFCVLSLSFIGAAAGTSE
jgi:F-type H+-transporting ATPase subunit a